MNDNFNLIKSPELPSQFDYYEVLSDTNKTSVSFAVTQPETVIMNNSFTSYRYYPPAEFTPSTPPPSLIKHRNSSDLSNDHRLQNDCHTNYNNRNSRCNLNGEYLTSTSTCEPLNTLCTDTQFMRSTSNTSPQINNVVMKKNLQNNNNIIHNTPVFHGRQHSMPIFLPSFTKFDDVQDKIDNNEITTDTDNSQGSKEINRLTLISDGLPGPITTNIMSNSTIDSSTSIQKTNLTSPNPSSLNLVIDIRLHGLGLSDSNRMTQSCIQEQVYDKTMDDNKLLSKTNYIKCSMDELLTNLDYCTLRCKPHRANSLIDQQNSSSQSSSHELNTSGGNRLSQRLNKLQWNKQNDHASRINSTDANLDNVNENRMKCSIDTNNWNSHINNNNKSEETQSRLRNKHRQYYHQHPRAYDRAIFMDQTNGTCVDDLRIRQTPIPNHRQFINHPQSNNLKLSNVNRYPTMPNINNSLKNPDYLESNSGTFSQSVDIPVLIRLLQSSDPDVVSNTAAYLQHLVYRNPSLKEKTRLSGGISALVQLLYSDHTRVCLNAVGVLRNLTCGDTLAIKKELERVGGIRALAWLIENRQVYGSTTDSFKDLNYGLSSNLIGTEYDDLHQAVKSILENAASVLCNLASVSWLKRSVLQEALIPSLLNVIIVPAAAETSIYASKDNGAQSIINSILFRIVASLIRNISSSEDDNVREQMRQCPQLATSLFSILRYAVEHRLYDKRSIEHCVCTIRNLCYGLQQQRQTQQSQQLQSPSQSSITSSSQDSKSQEKPRNGSLLRIKSASLVSGRKSKGLAKLEAKSRSLPSTDNESKSANIPSPYCDVDSVKTLIYLTQYSSNPYTLEAAAGSLQNLTAGHGSSSEHMREIIRLNHGLPLLVELLNNPMHAVVATAANALRNSALDPISCSLLGKHALNRIILALDQHPCGIAPSVHSNEYKTHSNNINSINNNINSEWQLPIQTSSLMNKTVSSTNHELFQYGEEVKSDVKNQCTAGLLSLCCIVIHKKLENARRFVTLGGVEKCQELLKFCINNGHLIRFDYNTDQLLNEDKTTQIVIKLLRQLLFMLWQFTELRPIYKLAGWSEIDFCIHKRSRLASLIKRRPKGVELPKRRVNSSFRQYTNGSVSDSEETHRQQFMYGSNHTRNNEMNFDEYTNHLDDLNESVYSLHGGQTSSYYIPAQTIVHESYNSDELTTLHHNRPHAIYIAEDDINNMSNNGNNAFEMINL
ncbi:Armadillo repeat protein deleted in velo-cardio-facial syndrome isoform 2 [Schistosoma japonicum]|uniref:Armadillo repeat protein deleted in velo-cardio-facial syndrome isoform 2 n=1 Tax=Schistosoma japonicum TaxID=6182 RepID=A0A4Z2D4Q4_SCHJA|nr:Armadillo repeat protein deleted in velo-cardio-facial syndrome isoform 2 [Schistosoma japonicum]